MRDACDFLYVPRRNTSIPNNPERNIEFIANTPQSQEMATKRLDLNNCYCYDNYLIIFSPAHHFPLRFHSDRSFFGSVPFRKKFPELGETTRLRIPESIAAHFETVMEHLDRQTFRWGPNYITAFVRQCEITMADLEAADCTEMVATSGESPHKTSPVSLCSLQPRHFIAADAEAYNAAIVSSFELLESHLNHGRRSTWNQLEQQLQKRRISANNLDIFHDICLGLRSVTPSELEAARVRFSGICPLIESFWDFQACRDHQPLAELRQRVAEINDLLPANGHRFRPPV